MSIRITLLYLVVAALSLYAWRDWFKSLCGLILLMAFIEHPDMPKSVMGIQGLNPWNVLMASVLLAWFVKRREEGLSWDMPQYINILLLLYLAVVVVGFLRMMADRSSLGQTTGTLVSENLINTIKWVIPGLLLFDGCRTRRRLVIGILSVFALCFMLGLLVIKNVPPSAVRGSADDLMRVRKNIKTNVGYSADNMSTMLAGSSWAILAMMPFARKRWQYVLIVGSFLAMVYAQALTGGRMGFAAWGVVGLTLCLLRWRKYLLLAPVIPIALYVAFPGAAGRLSQGFGETDVAGKAYIDDYALTSGRTLIWPYVIEKIVESPAIGYGRLAMSRTGLTSFLGGQFGKGDAFPHPHNAYLEWLLDNGVIGFIPIVIFYSIVLAYSGHLFRNSGNQWHVVIGGMTFALVLTQLLGGFGSQHFYPREGVLGMWAAICLTFRARQTERADIAARIRRSIASRHLPRRRRPVFDNSTAIGNRK